MIDIIFINENYEIVNTVKNIKANDRSLVPSDFEIKYALEVNAGFCKKNKIKVNDKIEFY